VRRGTRASIGIRNHPARGAWGLTMTKSVRGMAVAIALVCVVQGTARSEAQAQENGSAQVRATVDVVLPGEAKAEIRSYYASHPAPQARPLPPGIRKNLARGKPLPPGIASGPRRPTCGHGSRSPPGTSWWRWDWTSSSSRLRPRSSTTS
jgi:hypothetical protein